ncbi:HAD hydrolase-like protein [Oceanomicrobium pacificus]|uniref:HAD hydrolase-like protein n=1 Tax=Oceanomicrobium pacificus TaxID=2692916 RepID=A0A6B0TNB3_9RHOB|nr:HAD hydrolase-like protein [Oceanomicrobium pacificus]MXU64069.1 HAD hydrolase-like protein [Oceanomicrobium pacificus]
MSDSNQPTVFLDLDGTLIDPREGITRSIRHALTEMGMEDIPSADELTWCIGPPLWESFPVLLGEGADIEAAIGFYRERFTEEGVYEADVYDGIGDMLIDLQDLGAALYVATSKPHVYAQTILDHFGISSYVDGLFGSELDGTNSDKTQLLAHALAESRADPERSLMLGDRRHDIIGARNNDIVSIGALWGYGEPNELHMAEADALAGAPEEVGPSAEEFLFPDA